MKSNSENGKKELKKYPPRIVIKFQDSLQLPYHDEKQIRNHFRKNNVIPWTQLLKKFPGITISRLFTSLGAGEIVKLVNDAKDRDDKYIPPNFLTCFAIDCPHETNTDELLSILLSNKNVEDAYIECDPIPPTGNIAGANPMIPNQGYLNPAPEGVDAKYAWSLTGGTGDRRIKFIDIEMGWILDHEDIIGSGASILWGTESPDFKDHGSAVLGVILMQDNNTGGLGIAPKVNANVIAQLDANGRNVINDAILKAIDNLDAGDILLLEAQFTERDFPRKQWPVEVKSMTFHQIELAIAKGIIVIEAAGNGSFETNVGNDLDEYANRSNKKVLDRTSADFRDSGAIIVAAASDADSHGRRRSSNYGNRIDCFAWGRSVYTAGSSRNTYEPDFDGTSSASAIIAGVAIAVQSMVVASGKPRLTPAEMRNILSNELNGTTSRNRIGVMPDLKNIVNNVLSQLPAS